jgi:hypothetical protein
LEEVIFPSLFQLITSTWKKLFLEVFSGRSYFSKSFLTYYFNLEEVIFGSLFWKKLFFQLFFNLLLPLGGSYFFKSSSTWKKLFSKSFSTWKKLFLEVFCRRTLQ